MKKSLFTLFLIGTAIFIFTLSICAQEPIVLKLGGTNPPLSVEAQAAELFCEYVEEKTNGEVVVEYFPSATLGDGHSQILNVQVGLQDLAFFSAGFYAEFVRDFNILDMPYAIKDPEHLSKVLNAPFFQENLEELKNTLNTRILNYKFFTGARAYISRKKPIITPEDFVGFKARVPNIPMWEKHFRQLDAIPTQIAWSEYPFALMQGVIDGGEAMLSDIYPKKLHEAAPYITVVNFAWPINVLTMTESRFQGLSPEIQNVLLEAAEKMGEYFSNTIQSNWEETKQKLLKDGAVFIEVDREPFAKKIAPLADQLEKEDFWDTKGLYQMIQDLLDE